jgi:O-antigen ligase/polysaccharide polymerase Wzy-like membrane protein
MTSMLLLGLALLVVGGLGVLLVDLLITRPDVVAGLVLGSVVIEAIYVDSVPSLMLPGQTRVYVTDLVSALVLAAGVARLLRLHRLDRFHRWLVLLAVVLSISLIRGVASFGPQPSISDFRQYLFFAGVAMYFATFPPSDRLYDRIGRIWLAMTIPMMILVCLRWLAIFAGIDLGVPAEKYGADAAIRVIDGPYTFFLAGAFVLTIPAWLRGERAGWIRWMSVVLLLFVLVLNRRTVWLAVLVGVAVLSLRDRRLRPRAIALVTFGAVLTGIAFVSLGGLQEGMQPVIKSGSGNLDWRIQGWSELVGDWSHTVSDWVVGEPFGSGFAREIAGIATNTHPHNFYIETMIRTGLAGLIALIALTAGLLRALWHTPTRDTGLLGPSVVPALLAMQIVWFLTWVPGSEQGIVTGIACALAAAQSSSRNEFERPTSRSGRRELGPSLRRER